MSSAFDSVYGLYMVVVIAAPIVGLVALVSIRARGQAWLAWLGFVLALVLPALHAIAIISLGGQGIWPPPD